MTFESLEARLPLHGEAPTLPFTEGLSFRLSANVVESSAARVSAWNDLISGNSLTFSGNADERPTIMHGVLNGNDAIRFDGLNDALRSTTSVNLPTGSSNRTVIMLSSYHEAGWGFGFGATGSNQATGLGLGCKNSFCGHSATFGWGGGNDLIPTNVAIDVGWLVQAVVVDGNQRTIYRNGKSLVSDNNVPNTVSGAIQIGARLDGAEPTEVDVAEVLVFNRALSDNEFSQLQGYFEDTYYRFDNQFVVNAAQPLAIDFLPDGRMLVLQKTGEIFITDPNDGTASKSLYLDMPNVNSAGERGLLDIAFDPDFSTNGYFYVYYANATTGKMQISRFQHLGDTASLSDEFLVWRAPVAWQNEFHYGGSLNFGNDGKLYLTTGDEFNPALAQDLTHYGGKVLRINKDGSVPADNPFVDGPGGVLDEIYAYGLRNPYRATYDDASGRLYIGEVGGNVQIDAREDIHIAVAGANLGWPNCEGICGLPGTVDPIFSYPHLGTGAAVILGDVYRNGNFPTQYDGALFYGDYVRGWVRYLTFDSNLNVTGDYPFASDPGVIVEMTQGPDGALYYINLFGGVNRYVFRQGTQIPEITNASADVVAGPAPLTVQFMGSATSSGNTLSYIWDFGDGNSSATPNATHTYSSTGRYLATLSATNEFGTATSMAIPISVGVPPTVSITAPLNDSLFVAGDLIEFSALASDPDGTLSDSSYEWTVELIHNEHTHPGISNYNGPAGEFEIPRSGHDYSDATGYRLTVTVTDSDGLQATEVAEIFPDKVNISFATVPAGIPITLDQLPRSTPFVHDTLKGFEHELSVAASVCQGETNYVFDNWSNGLGRTQIYEVPFADASMTATFVASGACGLPVTNGLVLHLDADTGVTASGTSVVSWDDGSPLGNDLSFLGGAPTLVSGGLNGQSIVRFDGVDDALGLANPASFPVGASDRTIFVVAEYNTGNWAGFSYGTPQPNQAFGLIVAGGATGRLTVQGWGTGNDQISTQAGKGVGWMTHSVVYGGGTTFHFKDGAQIDSDLHTFDTGDSQLRLGVELNDNRHVGMDVAEVVVYDRALSAAERQSVESYLQSQYFAATPNSPPVGVADSYATVVGGTIDTQRDGLPSVLANDADPDNDPLTAQLVNGPAVGTLTFNADGSFRYVHTGSATAADSFTYRAFDGAELSSLVTVTLSISDPSLLPVQAGLAIHLDADQGVTTNGSTVVSWQDLSSNGNDVTVDDGGPTFVSSLINGRPAIRFDGIDDGLGANNLIGVSTGSSARTMFLVGNYLGGPWSGVSYGNTSPNQAFGLVTASGAGGRLTVQGWGSANDFVSTTNGVGQGWLTQSVVYDGSTITHYKNGLQIDTDAHAFNTGNSRIRLGVELNGNRHAQMDIAEVIIYDRALSESERNAVETYLQQQYLSSDNVAPIANPESYTVIEGKTLNSLSTGQPSLLANDFDGNGDGLTAFLDSPASQGEVTVNTDGTFVYVHNGNSTTADSFTYRAFDGAAFSLPATVTINVTPRNQTNIDIVRWHGDYFHHLWDAAFPGGSDPLVRENRWLRGGPPRGTLLNEQDLDLDSDGQLDDSRVYYQFSLDDELNPPDTTTKPNGLIYHTEMPSARFYGGLSAEFYNYGTKRIQQAFIENDGAGGDVADVGYPSPYLTPEYQGLRDFIENARHPDGRYKKSHIGPHEDFAINIYRPDLPHPIDPADDPADNLVTFSAAFLWKKEDFLGGGDTGTVSLDAASTFSFESTRWWEEIDGARWIIQDGDGQLYMSEFSVTGGIDDWGMTNELANPLATQWAIYTPAANDMDFDATAASWLDPIASGLFTDIQAVGIYIEKDTPSGELTRFSLDEIRFGAVISDAGENGAPIAVNDQFSVPLGTTLDTTAAGLPSLLANDTDPNQDTLTATLVAGPSHGALVLQPNGDFVYVHDGSEGVSDSFTYQASDGLLTSNIATVTINILRTTLPDFPGLAARFDATAGVVASGANVVSWRDDAGNGNDLMVVGGNPVLELDALNGNRVVSFDGVDDAMGRVGAVGLPTGDSERTVALVASYESGAWAGFAYGTAQPNAAFGLIASGGRRGRLVTQGWGTANDFQSSQFAQGEGWLSHIAVYSGNIVEQYSMGQLVGSDPHTYATTSERIRLGVELNDDRHMRMSVAEILVYDRALTAAERLMIEDYFVQRYGGFGGGAVTEDESKTLFDIGVPCGPDGSGCSNATSPTPGRLLPSLEGPPHAIALESTAVGSNPLESSVESNALESATSKSTALSNWRASRTQPALRSFASNQDLSTDLVDELFDKFERWDLSM